MAVRLALESCTQQTIENVRDDGVYLFGEQQEAIDFRTQHFMAKPKPNSLTKTYNCHGLTFAARRTAITRDVEKILNQDGYVEIQSADVWPGDIVAYYLDSSLGAEISHTAVVTHKESQALLVWIWVLSKWGAAEEYHHTVDNCPWGANTQKKYFRKR